MPKPLRIHEDRRKGQGVLPQRRHPFDDHPTRIHRLRRYTGDISGYRSDDGGLRIRLSEDKQRQRQLSEEHMLRTV